MNSFATAATLQHIKLNMKLNVKFFIAVNINISNVFI